MIWSRRNNVARFAVNTRGGLTATFAFALPLLLMVAAGMFELGRMRLYEHKTHRFLRNVVETISRLDVVRDADMEALLEQAGTILHPFDRSGMKLVVSSIRVKGKSPSGRPSIVCSVFTDDRSASPGRPDTTPAAQMPESLSKYFDAFVMAELDAAYVPLIKVEPVEWLLQRSAGPSKYTVLSHTRRGQVVRFEKPNGWDQCFPPSASRRR